MPALRAVEQVHWRHPTPPVVVSGKGERRSTAQGARGRLTRYQAPVVPDL